MSTTVIDPPAHDLTATRLGLTDIEALLARGPIQAFRVVRPVSPQDLVHNEQGQVQARPGSATYQAIQYLQYHWSDCCEAVTIQRRGIPLLSNGWRSLDGWDLALLPL